MNNFRLTGTYYVSKAGSDSNSGTSPDSPKASIGATLALVNANNQTIIISSGTYEEALTRIGTAYTGLNIFTDGNVTIQGDTTNAISIVGINGSLSNVV